MALTTLSFETPDALTDAFAQDLVSILKTGIKTRGRASLVVSGGPVSYTHLTLPTNREV